MLYFNLSCVYGCLLSFVSCCSCLGFIVVVLFSMGILLLSYVYYVRIAVHVRIAVYVLIAVVLYMPDCWLEVSIRKVLRPATSTQVFLDFPVSISEC
jgi:hypothetical protein